MTLTPKQGEALRLLKTYQNTLLHGGARSGKSFILVLSILHRVKRYPGSRHLIGRLHYNHAKASIWHETLIPLLRKAGGDFRPNLTDLYVSFANGSEIWVDGFDNEERVEKVLGREYGTILFNEVSEIPWAVVDKVRARLAQNIPGMQPRAFYDCNPPSPLHWAHRLFIEHRDPVSLDPLARPDLYGELAMNPADNRANLPAGYIENVLGNLSDRARRRFLYGEWLKAEGAIYDRFTEAMRIPLSAVPRREDGTLAVEYYTVGVDFGLNCAAVLIGWIGDHVYILADTGGLGIVSSQLNRQIRDMNDAIGEPLYYNAYCDPAGGERISEIDYGDEANNSVEPGLDYINTKIERGQFFVVETATGVLSEIWNYRRDEKGRVVKENDHYMDAMRYGIFTHGAIGAPSITRI